ncbi:MAG TPA: nucleotidyltransferase [Vicinamibacterales bacterium]|nr:nucleotidyltransferase [Vicinamibacterales bacterium]
MARDWRPRWGATLDRLSDEERKSLTHGDFWIPADVRRTYRLALETLNAAGVPYVVAGAYAIYEYTGIYRQTKDLDLFFEPSAVLPAARALKEAGFKVQLIDPHWLAKATSEGCCVDLIYGMGNGVAFVDRAWFEFSREGVLAGAPVRVAPAEELIWHRLFISERHRQDMADVLHVLLAVGETLDWDRLLARVGPHWPLLLAQVLVFGYVYPGFRTKVPRRVLEGLLERARAELGRDEGDPSITRGPLISRFSFAIDVQEWGFTSPRAELVRRAQSTDEVRRIAADPIWEVAEALPGRRAEDS